MVKVWNIDRVSYVGTGLGICCNWNGYGFVSSKRCILKIPTEISCKDSINDSKFVQEIDICNLAADAWTKFDHKASDIFGISC
jgi:hypothetical protein